MDLLGTKDGQPMVYLGRYYAPNSCGKDLTLADATCDMPVGLVPDFMYDGQLEQEVNERLSILGRHRVTLGGFHLVSFS
jgi:hypothetical protein